MATFADEIGRAVRQTACAVVATNDAINNLWVGSGLPDPLNLQRTTNSLRRQLCNNDSDEDLNLPDPPFQGGQCEGIEYRIEGQFYSCLYRPSDDVNVICGDAPYGNVIEGPVTRIEIEKGVGGAGKSIGPVAYNAAGDRVVLGIRSTTASDRDYRDGSLTSISIFRTDGGGDDCGDVVPPIPPYSPTPTTVTINYENNQQVTVNEDIDVTIFSPQLNLTGGIFAPVTIAGNTFNLVGTVELTPEFKLEVSPEINIGSGNGNPDETTPPPDRPIPEPEPDPNERRVIVGAIVTATSVASRQDFLPQAENPDIALPNLGYVAFYINTPNGTAWTADIPIKNVRSYIPCPVTGGAVDVAGTGRSGVTVQVQPVWGYPGQHLR